MNEQHPERKTLDAINSIKKSKPYAASLLIYCLIERYLKAYIIKYKDDDIKIKRDYKKTARCGCSISEKSIREFEGKEQAQVEQFLDEFLKKDRIALGEAGDIIRGQGWISNIASNRNELMHSKDLIEKYQLRETLKTTEDWQQHHEQKRDTAIAELQKIFNALDEEYEIYLTKKAKNLGIRRRPSPRA